MTSTLEDLPSEIFFRILAYLPALSLAQVSRVCVHWRTFSTDEYLWKYHCLNRWGYLNRTQKQLEEPAMSWLDFFKFNCIKSNRSYLVLGAEGGGQSDERLLDVGSKLKVGGLVNVDTFNVRTQTPSFEFLRNYNSIMFFSYHGFDQCKLGDLLAEFVEMGGGVVVCAYANCGRGNRLEGKWEERKYDPLTLGSTSRTRSLSLGKRILPKHPILDGVTSFDGGEQSSHGDGLVPPNTITIAEWNNGRPLITEKIEERKVMEMEVGGERREARRGGIVGLNMYPPSSHAATGGWEPTSRGGTLMANALYYVSRV